MRSGMFVAVALMVAPVVRGDFGVRGGVAEATSDLVLTFDNSESSVAESALGETLSPLASELQIELTAAGVGRLSSITFDGLDVSTPAIAVIELPPAPSSAGLFLSAMLSVGAWQLVRSSRDLNFSALPEWYHTGGPVQIGHATPFDLDFSTLVLCCFERPETGCSFHYVPRRDFGTRHVEQFISCSADPRGPPTQAG